MTEPAASDALVTAPVASLLELTEPFASLAAVTELLASSVESIALAAIFFRVTDLLTSVLPPIRFPPGSATHRHHERDECDGSGGVRSRKPASGMHGSWKPLFYCQILLLTRPPCHGHATHHTPSAEPMISLDQATLASCELRDTLFREVHKLGRTGAQGTRVRCDRAICRCAREHPARRRECHPLEPLVAVADEEQTIGAVRQVGGVADQTPPVRGPAVTTHLPSALNAASLTLPAWPSSTRTSCRSRRSRCVPCDRGSL